MGVATPRKFSSRCASWEPLPRLPLRPPHLNSRDWVGLPGARPPEADIPRMRRVEEEPPRDPDAGLALTEVSQRLQGPADRGGLESGRHLRHELFPLEPEGRDAGGEGGHETGRPEPLDQRATGSHGGSSRLLRTSGTSTPCAPSGQSGPARRLPNDRTGGSDSPRPARGRQVCPTRRLGGKAALELSRRLRKVRAWQRASDRSPHTLYLGVS